MKDLEGYTKWVKEWHLKAVGSDKYLKWKVDWLLSRYTPEEIKESVRHLNSQREGNLLYPIEDIEKEIDKHECGN